MSQPEEDFAHGRAWTHAELSYKSFEDLHGLFWVCVKERNRISTSKKERDRVHAGYGEYESGGRKAQVCGELILMMLCKKEVVSNSGLTALSGLGGFVDSYLSLLNLVPARNVALHAFKQIPGALCYSHDMGATILQ